MNHERHIPCPEPDCDGLFKSQRSMEQHRDALGPRSHKGTLAKLRRRDRRNQRLRAASRVTNKEMNTYIARELQPDSEFNSRCRECINKIASFLKEESNLPVAEVKKGGSQSKGTAVKGKSDVDLVVYVSDFDGVNNLKSNVKRALDELHDELSKWSSRLYDGWEVEVKPETTPHAVQLKIRKLPSVPFVDVDVLPSSVFDPAEAYKLMGDLSKWERGFFSPGLTHLQNKFVQEKAPTKVKDAIKYMKDWKTKTFEKLPSSAGRLPSSCLFEFLTIGTWEEIGSPGSFEMKELVDNVMKKLVNYQHIDMEWSSWTGHPAVEKKKPGKPYILDPSNPYNNVCDGIRTWEEVAREAAIARRAL